MTWQAAPSPPAARRNSTLEQSLGQSKGIYLPSSLSHLPLAKIITCRSHHLAPFWPLRAKCPHSQDAVFCASLKEEEGPSPLDIEKAGRRSWWESDSGRGWRPGMAGEEHSPFLFAVAAGIYSCPTLHSSGWLTTFPQFHLHPLQTSESV